MGRFSVRHPKLIDYEKLKTLRGENPSRKIVHCHGVFDVLHAGHLAYFQSAKKFGDMLVVTVTADEFVNKGPGRPHFNGKIRAEMLAALELVDYVAISHFPTAVQSIQTLRPHFYVKGPDYRDKAKDVTGAILAEETEVERHGGKLVFTDDPTHSSSSLINMFFHQWSEDQQKVIDQVKKIGGLATIEKVLDKAAQESLTLVGEPIVDTYIFCAPENISSKSPSISAKYLYQEDYTGGVLAIANHLADFAKEVHLLTTHGGESYFTNLLNEKLDKRIKLFARELTNVPTPRKTRYIASGNSQRLFELTELRSDQWETHQPEEFCAEVLKANKSRSATILADFGHGLFEGKVLEAASKLEGFIGLNVQTNSSNFGFNPYTKHRRFSYLSIDTKEARVAYHNRLASPLDLAKRLVKDVRSQNAAFSMTLGASGAYYFPRGIAEEVSCPALTDTVIDATGAGDAYFAMTSLLIKADCPPVLVPFLGNVFAGLKAKIVGNKNPVSRAQFLKALTSILK